MMAAKLYHIISFPPNSVHNKYTMTAKAVLKMCRNQMMEIETCPDCFLASCTQENNWFCKPCVSFSRALCLPEIPLT